MKVKDGGLFMKYEFDFYDKTNLKSYNLNENMRYQLNMHIVQKDLRNIARFVLIYMTLENYLFLQQSFKSLEN